MVAGVQVSDVIFARSYPSINHTFLSINIFKKSAVMTGRRLSRTWSEYKNEFISFTKRFELTECFLAYYNADIILLKKNLTISQQLSTIHALVSDIFLCVAHSSARQGAVTVFERGYGRQTVSR